MTINSVLLPYLYKGYMTSDKLLFRTDKQNPTAVFMAVAFSLTFILCWMDEGYYDLRWMKSGHNWVCFCIYFAGFTAGMAIVSEFILKNRYNNRSLITRMLLGLPVGVLLIFCFMYTFALLQGVLSFLVNF